MVSSIATGGYGLGQAFEQTNAADVHAKTTTVATRAYAQSQPVPTTSVSSVTITLSDQARAALAAPTDSRPLATVVVSSRAALDTLLKDGKAITALKDGRATIDLSGLDRRSLWAVATNAEGKFAIEEQVVATLQLNERRDKALAGSAAAVRVTGDYAGLYRSYLNTLDSAGPEEKVSAQWATERAAVIKGLDQAIAKPAVAPVVEGDPVAVYLKESGGVVASPRSRDISKVVPDVRAVLDHQYATASAEGRSDNADRGTIDFSRFDDRSLAAVALNKGDAFSEHEIALAASQVKARNRDMISDQYASASNSADPSAFGKSIITRYAVMSDEERQASGWTPALYDRVVELQNMAERIASMFSPTGSVKAGAMTLLDYL